MVYAGPNAVVPFPEILIDLPLARTYDDIEFVPDTEEDETA
jgi:hypothetical protein